MQIRQLGEAWMAAALRFDVETACSYLAPEFTMVTSRGSLVNAEQWRTNLSGRITSGGGGFLESDVKVYGDTALMLSRWQHQATFDGKDWSGTMYITDVWIKRDGRWQVVRRHSSIVDPTAS